MLLPYASHWSIYLVINVKFLEPVSKSKDVFDCKPPKPSLIYDELFLNDAVSLEVHLQQFPHVF